MAVKVKICGITNKEDAFWASSLGADFIGLNFYKNSIRKVSLKNAKDIVNSLPSYTCVVGVFVDESLEEILKICSKVSFNYVQLHGNEEVEYCKNLKLSNSNIKIIKVFKIKPEVEIQNMEGYVESLYQKISQYKEYIDYLLFDTYIETEPGGTGEIFCWSVVKKLKEKMQNENFNINFFIAGGLNTDNVEKLIEELEPWGVDVASGVERLPRRKDFDKMKEFIRKVKSVK
ncbi:MAG: phosphoribosylanthranilate isomerase [Endomicrobiia bacterium]